MAASVLIAGCGDLGGAVAARLIRQGCVVTGIRRSPGAMVEGAHLIQADVRSPAMLQQLAAIRPEILLYCVAADVRTDDSYKSCYVDGLCNVLTALRPGRTLRHVFFVSSTRVYGQQDVWLDEESSVLPADFGGHRLLQAERLLQAAEVSSTVLRLSGVYGPGRTRLSEMAKKPETWPSDNVWTNRIHRDDAADFIAFCIMRAMGGEALAPLYLVTDSLPAPRHEVLRWLASRLGVACDTVAPPVTGGRRFSNQRLLASGFRLHYPDYMAGYGAMLDCAD
ncbi:MAG TPA: SDR family oxidoreductase [Methylophilaceae bacterium]|jgi:nucleoside-diphosphate-sugar epimerase